DGGARAVARRPMSFLNLGDYSAATLAFVAASAIVAGLARGFSGFGAALIFIPLASTAIGPRTAAALLLVVDIVMASPLLPRAWTMAARHNCDTILLGSTVARSFCPLIMTTLSP